MALVRWFFSFNTKLCRALDRVWAYPSEAWPNYAREAGKLAAAAHPARVVDVGAGRDTEYSRALAGANIELIGLDVLAEDMADNKALSQRIVCDIVVDGLPDSVNNAGLVTSRMVLEHIPDQAKSARELYAALAPGGKTIHLFAARYSIFAILNRILPEALATRILFTLRPASVDVGGFQTHYDRTHALAAETVFRDAGFVNVRTEVSYQTSQYFTFFFPLFVLARLWETAILKSGRKNLGSYVLLFAERAE